MLKKQNVTRDKYAEGIDLAIYKRCGRKPVDAGSNENDKFQKRRMMVKGHAGAEVMTALDQICEDYETGFLCK